MKRMIWLWINDRFPEIYTRWIIIVQWIPRKWTARTRVRQGGACGVMLRADEGAGRPWGPHSRARARGGVFKLKVCRPPLGGGNRLGRACSHSTSALPRAIQETVESIQRLESQGSENQCLLSTLTHLVSETGRICTCISLALSLQHSLYIHTHCFSLH